MEEHMVKVLGLIILSIAAVIGLAILFAFPTMWIINYLFTAQLLVYVFGVAKISLWQAWVFNIFASLFKSVSTSSK
jgi:hypothetical protein